MMEKNEFLLESNNVSVKAMVYLKKKNNEFILENNEC